MLQRPIISSQDQEQAYVSRALEIILWTLMAAVLLWLVGIFFLPSFTGRWLAITFSCYGLCIPVFFLNRRGHTRLAAILLIVGLWILLTVFAVTAGGITSYAASYYLVVIFVAGLLLGPRAAIITALLCILTTFGLVVIEMLGQMPSRVLPYTPLTRWLALTVLTIVMMALQYFSARTIKEALSHTRRELDERKRAVTALCASEEKYRSLIEQAPDAIFIADSSLHFVDTNTSACELIGYTREEILNSSILDVTPDEDAPVLMSRIERLRGGETIIAKRSIKRKDGTVVPLEMSTKMLSDGRLQAIARDITERMRADEALRASERRFSIAFNASPVSSAISTLEGGDFVAVNERFLSITGYRRDEVIGRTALELNMWPNLAERDRLLQKLAEDGRVCDFEAQSRLKSGEVRILLISVEKMELDGQQCVLYSAHDITERKQAEERLALLQTITMDVVSAKDLSSALEVVLRRVCEKTGWALGQAWVPNAERSALDCCPAWCATEAGLDHFRAVTQGGTMPAGTGLPGRVWAARQPVWIRDVTLDRNFPRAAAAKRAGLKAALGIPILSGTNLIAVLEFFLREPRDEDERLVTVISAVATQIGLVVERKQAEEALKSSSKQLRALSAKIHSTREEEGTRIAREIHDELGSALTGLKWDLEKLDTTLSKSGNGTELPEVRTQIGIMTSLIESTIDVVRRISSELRPGVLDDLGLVAAIDWQAHQFQARTGIRYHNKTTLKAVKLSRESATAVFRIFQEILTNVLRHSHATDVYVEVRNRAEHLELEVKDNGCGITETEKGNMRSLGLLGMRERALLVGGQVNIAGEKGRGTTVVVNVPIEPGLDGVGPCLRS